MSNDNFLNALNILSHGCNNAKEIQNMIKHKKLTSPAAPLVNKGGENISQTGKPSIKSKRKNAKELMKTPFAKYTGQQRADEVRHFLRSKGIKVWGDQLPEPIVHFQELLEPPYEIHTNLIESLSKGNLNSPLPVQMMVIPFMLSGFDTLASAPTGSGKTVAFLLPLLHLAALSKVSTANSLKPPSVQALIVAPTKELANQIHDEAIKLLECNTIEANRPILRCLTKSSEKETLRLQASEQGRKYALIHADILITTPKRLLWMVNRKKSFVDLTQLKWLVLDECDKLFGVYTTQKNKGKNKKKANEKASDADSSADEDNANTEKKVPSNEIHMDPQLDKIILCCKKAASAFHIALFSATYHPTIKRWARVQFTKPAFVQVGIENTAVKSVEQNLKYCTDDDGKEWELKYLLSPGSKGGLQPRQYPVLIFVRTKKRAFLLKSELLQSGIITDVISADRSELEREKLVERFRQGHLPSLICTELMARGMDFPLVSTVINYDLPSSPVEYIHRVGRTGRGVGPHSRGLAITFWTERDKKEVTEGKKTALGSEGDHGGPLLGIMNVMVQSGVAVNEELHTFLRTHRNGRKRKFPQTSRRQGQENDKQPKLE